jgi:hypothetical protein
VSKRDHDRATSVSIRVLPIVPDLDRAVASPTFGHVAGLIRARYRGTIPYECGVPPCRRT